MASNIKPIPPPLGAPMLDDRGIVHPAWANFFTMVYRYEQAISESVADGTYTIGNGTTDGTITILNGAITDIQEVVA